MVKVYKNGAWEDISIAREYVNGAWQDVQSIKAYKNSAWEDMMPTTIEVPVIITSNTARYMDDFNYGIYNNGTLWIDWDNSSNDIDYEHVDVTIQSNYAGVKSVEWFSQQVNNFEEIDVSIWNSNSRNNTYHDFSNTVSITNGMKRLILTTASGSRRYGPYGYINIYPNYGYKFSI